MLGLRQFVLHQLIPRDDAGAPILIDMREPGYLERLLDVVEQVLLVDRLGEESERPALGGMHGVGNRPVCGENDHLETGPAALQLFEQSDAVHLVHAKIRDDEIRSETGAGRQRRGGAFDRLHLVILRPQADGQKAQQTRVVVDHQDPRLALLLGIRELGVVRPNDRGVVAAIE